MFPTFGQITLNTNTDCVIKSIQLVANTNGDPHPTLTMTVSGSTYSIGVTHLADYETIMDHDFYI